MRLTWSDELDAFRSEVRGWIAANKPDLKAKPGSRAPGSAAELAVRKAWGAELFAAGYLGGGWPPRWGGRGEAHDPMCDVIVAEEIALADAPEPPGVNPLAAHAFLRYGTPEQQAFFLPRLRAYRDVWCQFFSEPEAGSDLASLRTSARPEGDAYVVDGQKVWSTYSAWADYALLLAQTHPDAPKHQGITAFALDMRTPGIDVRPLREITGTSDFSEVFLDSVLVPASAVIGEPGQGWTVAMTTLAAERTGVGATSIRLQRRVRDLVALARRSGEAVDPGVTRDVGRLHAMVRTANLLVALGQSRARHGRPEPGDAAVSKLFFSELYVELAAYALGLMDADGTLVEGDPAAVNGGVWQDMWLYSRAYTIAGGSSEIMRNLISERGLGLPREARG